MPVLPISPTTLAAIVIALSFAAGLNVYATVFSLGTMARLHWIALPPGLHAIADTWVIAVSGILFAGEFVADKIPGFDLIWNALHTFVRIPVAALMAYGVGEHLSPEMHLLITCLGAVIAAIAHGSKTAARILVTPSPEPFSNIALSTTEDGAAIGLSWLVLHHPVAAGGGVLALSAGCVAATWLSFKMLRRAPRSRFREGASVAPRTKQIPSE
jgi:hypothetical protein